MKTFLAILFGLVITVNAAAPPQPIRANPWSTNAPANTISNASPIVTSSLITVQTGGAVGVESTGWFKTTNTLNGQVNVLAFGAEPNGLTDCTAALQDAFNTVAPTHGTVFLVPQNVYNVSSTLHLTNGFRINGAGAIIKMTGNPTAPTFLLTNGFAGGVIESVFFDTDSTGLGVPPHAIRSGSDGQDNLRIQNCRFNNLLVHLRNTTPSGGPATLTNLWVQNNVWTGNFAGQTGGDQCVLLDIRGWVDGSITDNSFNALHEERQIHLTVSGRNWTITGNKFISLLPDANSNALIDAFSDSRRVIFANNIFYVTNGYSDLILIKPTSSTFSNPSEVIVANNIIEHHTPSAFAAPISLYGSWGLSDNLLTNSLATVIGNQVKVVAPNGTYSLITVRGFTQAVVADNTVTRPELIANAKCLDVANNENTVISGNIFKGGTVTSASNQSNPPGTTYTNCPVTLSITGNTILGAPSFGCIWLTTLTNQAGLMSLNITGNTLYPTNNTGAVTALIRMDNCYVQDATIVGNVGRSDYADLLLLNGTVITNLQHTANSWQTAGTPPVFIAQTGTNVVVDYDINALQMVAATNTIRISVTNCIAGETRQLRIFAFDGDVNISFDPTGIALVGMNVTKVEQFSSTTVSFTARSSNCGASDVTAVIDTTGTPISLADGVIYMDNLNVAATGFINAVQAVTATVGSLTMTNTITLGGVSRSTWPAVTAGYAHFPGATYTVTDSWADVVFTATTWQTDALTTGTWLVTAIGTYEVPQVTGEAQGVQIRLLNTETSTEIDGSYMLVTCEAVSPATNRIVPFSTQCVITITTSGRAKVQAQNNSPANENGLLLNGASLAKISWIKIN